MKKEIIMYTTTATESAQRTFAECSCLKGLSEADLAELDSQKTTLAVSKGDTIFHAGDPAENCYCVLSGEVQLFRTSATREQSFDIVGPGAWIGHRDLFSQSPYQHSARALTSVTVCKIQGSSVRRILEKRPQFALNMIREMATGWKGAEKQSYNLGARKTVERLADFLLELQHTHHHAEREEIEFPHTRETVATLLGTTTESVIRMMSDFKARGYIDFSKGKIVLKNEKELARLVMES